MSEYVNPEFRVLFLPCAQLQVLSVSVCVSCFVLFAEPHNPFVTRIRYWLEWALDVPQQNLPEAGETELAQRLQ